ncbi:MAG: energy-coupling factor transporter transmembrane protein EcfT [Propionibacteriaceae bacterium]|nr:energy-coupling factor transporter transmembrane protein EcfT [Propionibacteriaceae bacterium]
MSTLADAEADAPPLPPNRTRSRAWLDPRTKLVVLMLLNPVAFSNAATGAAWWARVAAMILIAGLWLTLRRWRPVLVFAVAFAAAWGLVVLSRSLPGPWALLGGMGTVVLLMLPVAALAAYCVVSTQVSELVAALERLRIPQQIVIPLSVVLRFFPTIAEEYGSIGDAMRMRGIGLGGRTRNPVTMLEYRFVPLLMSVVRIGDELSAAALTRGLGGPNRRSVVCRIGFGPADAVVLGLAAIPLAIWLGSVVPV